MTTVLDAPLGQQLAEHDRAVLHRAATVLHREGQITAAMRLHTIADTGLGQDPVVPVAGSRLTPAELRAVIAMARGGTRAQAGRRLHITEGTVAKQLRRARVKTSATSTAQLVAICIAQGWIPVDTALPLPSGRRL